MLSLLAPRRKRCPESTHMGPKGSDPGNMFVCVRMPPRLLPLPFFLSLPPQGMEGPPSVRTFVGGVCVCVEGAGGKSQRPALLNIPPPFSGGAKSGFWPGGRGGGLALGWGQMVVVRRTTAFGPLGAAAGCLLEPCVGTLERGGLCARKMWEGMASRRGPGLLRRSDV